MPDHVGQPERSSLPEQLQRQASLLDALLGTTSDRVFVLDRDGRYRYVNPAGAERVGLEPLAMVGKHWRELGLDPVVMEQIDAEREQVLSSGTSIRSQGAWPAASARVPGRFEYVVSPLLDGDGVVESVLVVSRDGEESESERELRERERAFRTVFEHAPLGVALVAADGTWLRVNARLCEILGYSSEELAETTFAAITHPDDLPASLAHTQRLARGEGERFVLEKRYVRKDGSAVWVSTSGSAARAPDGSLRYFVAVVEEIEARRRAEASAAQSQAMLETVLSSAPLGFALIDRELRYLQLNERLAEMNGAPVEAHLGRSVAEMLPGLPAEAFEPHFKRVLETGEPLLGVEVEGATDAAPGVLRSFREDWYPIRVDGEIVALAALVTETTDEKLLAAERERLAAEAAIAEERARTVRVLDAVGDGVVAVSHEETVSFLNPAAARILQTTSAEAVGAPAAAILGGWERARNGIPVADESDSAGSATLAFTVAGRERWLSIGGVRYADGIAYAFRDVSDREELEQLRHDFVTTLSHELRTPLAAVYGAAQTLQQRGPGLGEALRQRLLATMLEQSERLNGLAEQILLVGQVDAGSVRLEIRTVNPNRLIGALVGSYQATLPPNLALEIREATAPPVAADEQQLESVLALLIENAIKYSPDGGTIAIAATRSDTGARLSISDPGIGIPAAAQERIFEKFYRADPEQTRGVGGTGLGLYLARTLIERMGGHISVDSAPGRGSSFHVELPAA